MKARNQPRHDNPKANNTTSGLNVFVPNWYTTANEIPEIISPKVAMNGNIISIYLFNNSFFFGENNFLKPVPKVRQ